MYQNTPEIVLIVIGLLIEYGDMQ